MPSQNDSPNKLLSESDNGVVYETGGRERNSRGWVGEGENFREDQFKHSKCHPKINLYTKILSKMDNAKVLKSIRKGRIGKRGRGRNKKKWNVTNGIQKLIYAPNFIRIGQCEIIQSRKKRLREGAEFSVGIAKKYTNVINSIPKWIYIASCNKIVQWKSIQIRGKCLGEGNSRGKSTRLLLLGHRWKVCAHK